MDEDDGRPGGLTEQLGVPGDRSSSLGWARFGPRDARPDALPLSLLPAAAFVAPASWPAATWASQPTFLPAPTSSSSMHRLLPRMEPSSAFRREEDRWGFCPGIAQRGERLVTGRDLSRAPARSLVNPARFNPCLPIHPAQPVSSSPLSQRTHVFPHSSLHHQGEVA